MSTAYFIVLNSDDPGFDPFVDGKMLTKRLPWVNKIAGNLGLKQFEDYAYHDLSDFDGPKVQPQWFDAAEGISWASTLLQHIQENQHVATDIDLVAADLKGYVRVFEEAEKRGLKWHLELDF